MRRDAKNLARLQAVAKLISDRDLARVAAQSARCDAIERKIGAIKAHRSQLAASVEDPVHAALLGQQSERLRREQAAETAQLARAKVALDIEKAQARPSFGRQAVLATLMNRTK